MQQLPSHRQDQLPLRLDAVPVAAVEHPGLAVGRHEVYRPVSLLHPHRVRRPAAQVVLDHPAELPAHQEERVPVPSVPRQDSQEVARDVPVPRPRPGLEEGGATQVDVSVVSPHTPRAVTVLPSAEVTTLIPYGQDVL